VREVRVAKPGTSRSLVTGSGRAATAVAPRAARFTSVGGTHTSGTTAAALARFEVAEGDAASTQPLFDAANTASAKASPKPSRRFMAVSLQAIWTFFLIGQPRSGLLLRVRLRADLLLMERLLATPHPLIRLSSDY
jgi:hypothetical protein